MASCFHLCISIDIARLHSIMVKTTGCVQLCSADGSLRNITALTGAFSSIVQPMFPYSHDVVFHYIGPIARQCQIISDIDRCL